MNLRPYQDDTLHHAYLAEQAGLNRLLVALPTGTGKTIIFGQWLNERKGRAVVIAHRDELIRQAVHKLGLILPKDVTVGVVKAEEHQPEAEVVVASIQSLTPARLRSINNVCAIVIDEAHHSEADTYQRALKHLGAYNGVMTLGVTATPYRGDGKDLAKTWQKLVYSMQIKDAIKAGHLCALRAYRVSTKANFSKLKVLHGDVHQGQAGAELLAAGAPEQIAQAVEQHAVGRPTLIFCPTVEVSMEVENAIRKVKRNCLHVDGTTDPGTRANAIKLLQGGGVVTNCGIYTEGFDCPEVSCIVIARPTKSQTLYVQMIGRGTRNHPGKDNCVILDVVGASMRHDLCTAMILAVGASELERELLAKQKKRDETAHGIGGSGPIQALEIDLWGARPFAWVKTSLGYVLEVGGYGKLLLGQDGARWALWQRQGETQRKLWLGDDIGYGQGFAEDWCRGKSLDGLCRKDAPWREGRITDGQKHALTKLRIPWTESTTKGQASDAITWAIANSGRW